MVARFLLVVASVTLALVSAAHLRELPAGQVCDIENGFDYVGQDIKNVPGSVDKCCDLCRVTDKCNAWSWSNYNGGTCWLKSGADKIVVNPNVKSARMVWTATGSNHCKYFPDVDFVGNDLANFKRSQVGDCCDLCRNTLGCRAYSWSDYQGGTCWLKSKRDKAVYKPGVKSADAYQSGYPFFAPVFPMQTDVDFVDHDIGSKPANDPYLCGQLCYDFTSNSGNCMTYSWNNYNGGTCWLKSKNETKVSKSGVTSAVIAGYVDSIY